jgi:hypothetical protein
MAGLVPAIHAGTLRQCCKALRSGAAWLPATSAGMTLKGDVLTIAAAMQG